MNSAENGADGGSVITGTQLRYGWNGRKPYHATNFVTAHDGFTMYDLFSFNEKNNNCGPLNPVCCDDPTSAWCDTASGESNNRSRDWGDEEIKRQQMRNMFVGMAISYGTPMILGGDEWMRTQYGNNNAYSTSADNEWNWFRWGEWQAQDERWRMHDFVSKIMAYRLAHTAAFAPLDYDSGLPISWESASGGSANWGSRQLMIHYTDNGTGSPEIVVLLNFERYNVDFTLPPGNWGRIADTQRYFDGDDYLSTSGGDLRQSANIDPTGATVVSGVYGVADSSIVILEQR
jgi:glycogen operon protein